jgi:3-dehydrosphinganine reductase
MFTIIFGLSFVALVLYIVCSLVVESTPKLNLSKKHVIITGGSQGIGFSSAKKFCKEGAHVTIIARNKGNLLSAVKELESLKVDQNQKNQLDLS